MEMYAVRPDALIPGTLVGNWRVLQRLGHGSQGAVYRVEDVRQPREHLVLRISLRAAEGRFDQWTAQLKRAHPNVVLLHACGRWPRPRSGFFYSVRDYVKGQALTNWVETVNPTFLQGAAILSRLALAIDDMHQRDVWHRDIRPDNIRVRDGDGEPVLLDLRAGGNEEVDTLTRMPLPTELLMYRSPEALRFLRMNWGRRGVRYHFRPSDDLYALGATAYWLVTGHMPFSPALAPDVLHGALEMRMPVAPHEVNPRVPRAFSALILRLLEKEPDYRPRSGEALNAELVAAVSAGARSIWASRIFDWCRDEAGQELSPLRILRPTAPWEGSSGCPRLPRVVHFNPPYDKALLPFEPPPWCANPVPVRKCPEEPMGPWSQMM
ncbi:serine/threonine protein kinase [Stigmatella aurantiaca]|uniref:serine/threonine protein kinase n=1 Tax=Stigmatella aurantiaca TaxID=41 RepID=UPI001FE2F36B|nr:serine/threonine-protein kinase [Stigmatella aurantiaca]